MFRKKVWKIQATRNQEFSNPLTRQGGQEVENENLQNKSVFKEGERQKLGWNESTQSGSGSS